MVFKGGWPFRSRPDYKTAILLSERKRAKTHADQPYCKRGDGVAKTPYAIVSRTSHVDQETNDNAPPVSSCRFLFYATGIIDNFCPPRLSSFCKALCAIKTQTALSTVRSNRSKVPQPIDCWISTQQKVGFLSVKIGPLERPLRLNLLHCQMSDAAHASFSA